MNVVTDLVIAPFNEIVEKATAAHENAGDNKEMQAESQKLVRGAERILKTVVPLCTRLYTEHERNFIDELKQHDEIAKYRLELNDLLWDFEDFMEADAFEKDAYVNLQKLCKNAGLAIGEILKRMKLEPVAKPPGDVGASPASTATAHVPALSHSSSPAPVGGLNIIVHPEPEVPATPEPHKKEQGEGRVEEEEEPLATPPPPPPTNPWDIKTTPNIDSHLDIDELENIRRPPVSSGDSDIVSPSSPEGMHANPIASPPRRLDVGVTIMEAEEQRRRMTTESLPSRVNAAVQPETPDRNPFRVSDRSLTSSSAPPVREPEFPLTATILPSREHRDSLGSSVRSRESMQETSLSPVQSGNRGSVQSVPENPDAITGGDHGYPSPVSRVPTIPANFPPGIQDGIEIVPREYNAGDGLIPVESESSGHSVSAGPRTSSGPPPRDCSLGLNSSFFLYKGFCEGAKETTRGGGGVKKVKKPGFQGSHTVARCTGCDFESDSHHLELDQKQSEAENFVCSGVGYRVRFLQKSHMATKRSDEQLFGCVFCAHSQRTLEECDATVFFSPRKLFEHLARHPRPLPAVPGFTVVEEAEVPFNLRNNYDLHFKKRQVPSPLDAVRDEIAPMPAAVAIKPVRKMYGMRMLHDQTPAFELADGARITGIEFPAKYQGEWALGWHDAAKKSVPFDVIRLVPPPQNEVKMGGTSTITAVARWKFAPKAKDGEWLKFDKGEFISNISFAYSDHWCWSGTNAKGKWGIFPQTFIDTNTVREVSTDRASIISNESKKFRFSISRKGGVRPPSFTGPAGGSTGRVF